jgi:hypothetical protein
MSPGNAEAMVHYQDTIRNKVAFDRIAPHVSSGLARKLQQVFGSHPIAVWGSRDSSANRAKFPRFVDVNSIRLGELLLCSLPNGSDRMVEQARTLVSKSEKTMVVEGTREGVEILLEIIRK